MIIPYNKNENHWILILVKREERIIEIYEPFQLDNCDEATELILRMESFIGLQEYSIVFKTNFPKQLDDFNCGIVTMSIVYNNYDLTDYSWNDIEDFGQLFYELISEVLQI